MLLTHDMYAKKIKSFTLHHVKRTKVTAASTAHQSMLQIDVQLKGKSVLHVVEGITFQIQKLVEIIK